MQRYSVNKGVDPFAAGWLVAFYLFVQLLAVPLWRAASGEASLFTASFYMATAGIGMYLVGYNLFNMRFRDCWRRPYSVLDRPWGWETVSIMIIGLFLAGFIIKGRHCVSAMNPGACVDDLGRNAFSPNLFHQLGATLLLCYLADLRRIWPKYSLYLKGSSFVMMLLFLGWISWFGEGRFFMMASLFSFVIIEWYFGTRKDHYLFIFYGTVILFLWFLRSWFKLQLMSADYVAQLTVGEFLFSSTVGRIAQNHILSSVVINWDGPWLHFAGWPDFFHQLFSRPLHFLDGNDFGKPFILGYNDHRTGVGPTFMGDFYLNAGWSGVLVGMCLVGMIFRAVYEIRIACGLRCGTFIYASMLPIMVHGVEDWVFLSLARDLSTFLSCLVICMGLILLGRVFLRNNAYARGV